MTRSPDQKGISEAAPGVADSTHDPFVAKIGGRSVYTSLMLCISVSWIDEDETCELYGAARVTRCFVL